MKKDKYSVVFLIGEAALLLAIIILEILPYGISLKFGHLATDDTVTYSYVNYSYFDITPFGLGVIFPIFIGIFSAISILLFAIFAIDNLFKNKWTMNVLIVLQTLVFLLSIFQVSVMPVTVIVMVLIMSGLFVIAEIVHKMISSNHPSRDLSKQ